MTPDSLKGFWEHMLRSVFAPVPTDLWCSVSSWRPRSRFSWLSIFSDPSGSTPPERGCAGGGRRGSSRCFLLRIWIYSLGERRRSNDEILTLRCCLGCDVFPSGTYRAMPGHSTENSAGTGQQPLAGQSSPEPASCKSLSPGISAGCPEENNRWDCEAHMMNVRQSIRSKSQVFLNRQSSLV